MAECNTGEMECSLMENMDDTLRELLIKENINSNKLVEYLNIQGITTLNEFFEQNPYDLQKFMTAFEYDRLTMLFKKTSKPDHTNIFPESMDIDEHSWDDTNKYKIVKDSKGMIGNALIIVNKHFSDGTYRKGADKDCENLETMFKNLNVRTDSHKDLDRLSMEKTLREFANKEEEVSIVFVAISTHGDENNSVLSTDKKPILIDNITNIFQKNKSLVGKPKIFFIQACRGRLTDERIPVAGNVSDHLSQDSSPPKEETKPKQTYATAKSDILIAYATSDKYLAWRNSRNGSWFITELKKSFEKYPNRNLFEILTITSQVIIQEYGLEQGELRTQCCNFQSSLTKFVYL